MRWPRRGVRCEVRLSRRGIRLAATLGLVGSSVRRLWCRGSISCCWGPAGVCDGWGIVSTGANRAERRGATYPLVSLRRPIVTDWRGCRRFRECRKSGRKPKPVLSGQSLLLAANGVLEKKLWTRMAGCGPGTNAAAYLAVIGSTVSSAASPGVSNAGSWYFRTMDCH